MAQAESEAKPVKVKILMHVGPWKPGDEVEVHPTQAEHLCKPTVVDKGGVLVQQRKAMTLDEAEKAKTVKVDMSKITLPELQELGRKNIVATPKDDAFDRKLAKLVAGAAVKPDEKADEAPTKGKGK